LTDAETTALLEAFGSPLEVAGRYGQDTRVLAFGRVLVGPVLFPFYTKVLGFNLGITTAAIVIIGAALRMPIASLVQALLIHLGIQFGIVTVIFSLTQAGLTRRPNAFNVQGPSSSARRGDGKSRISRLESLSQILALAILLAWLPALRDFGLAACAEAGVAPASFWHAVYVTLAWLWGAGIVQAGVNTVRPDWVRFRSVARLASDFVWLGMVLALLGAGQWVAPLETSGPAAVAQARAAKAVNDGLFISLVVTAVASAIAVFFETRRSIRATRYVSAS